MSNRQNFTHAVECFADPQKRDQYFRLYSEDIVLHGYQGVEPGLESVKQFYQAFWAVFPDARVTLQEVLEEADTLVTRYVITGTQHKAFMGVPRPGSGSHCQGSASCISEGGRCFERWAAQIPCCCQSDRGADAPYLLNRLRKRGVL